MPVGHHYLMTQREGSDLKKSVIQIVKNVSRVDKKCSITFYTRVHYGSLDPTLASEKRAERESCLAYGDISGVCKDGASYGNSCNYYEVCDLVFENCQTKAERT